MTGANSETIKWSALALAQKGAKVYLACRSRDKADIAMKWSRKECNNKDAMILESSEYDASSL